MLDAVLECELFGRRRGGVISVILQHAKEEPCAYIADGASDAKGTNGSTKAKA